VAVRACDVSDTDATWCRALKVNRFAEDKLTLGVNFLWNVEQYGNGAISTIRFLLFKAINNESLGLRV
jgi:hypothetical protein